MKTNLFFVNKFIIVSFLITSAYTFNMHHRRNDFYIKNSIIAANHNRNNTLLKLPDDILQFILALSIDTTKPLKDIIKPALLLSTTCKRFNVEQLGKACKNYSFEEKNKTMEMLLKSMNDFNYHNKRQAALLLTYAGAKNDAYKYSPLLTKAAQRSDEQMIIALFENNTSPNQKYFNKSACFDINNVNIAQIFVKYGASLNTQDYWLFPNILFASLSYNYSPELIEFYINNKVDVTKKGPKNNNLLHKLAINNYDAYTIDNCIKIGILFIKTAPELLNELNDDGNTPLDIAKQELKLKKNTAHQQRQQALITLFEEYGDKTAKQLKQDTI